MSDQNLEREPVEETGEAPADTEAPNEDQPLPEHDEADSASGTDV
ncbi:hypothetical protein [Paractinoplanes maris]|nr:hypothetical protein [Actinoplanes maris]